MTVERMVGKGAQLSQAEREQVIQYLTETYPSSLLARYSSPIVEDWTLGKTYCIQHAIELGRRNG